MFRAPLPLPMRFSLENNGGRSRTGAGKRREPETATPRRGRPVAPTFTSSGGGDG